jgi:hypothetical protein
MTYAPLGTPRFHFVPAGAGEMLIIPARRNILVTPFLAVWLGAWTVGGVAAMSQLLVKFHIFVAFWLAGWAIGWIMVATILSWMLSGRELVQVTGGDLEVGYSVWGIHRRKLFRGADVRGLRAVPEAGYWHGRQFPPMPVLGQSRGAVQFSYGARTQSFGFGLDSTEAAEIVAWLRKKLPEATA